MQTFRMRREVKRLAVFSGCYTPLLLTGAILMCAANRPVWADVKVVTELSVSGVGGPSDPAQPPSGPPQNPSTDGEPSPPGSQTPVQTVTIYYKGGMARRETAGGLVMLYDSAAGKVYALNPTQKTYSVVGTKDVFKWLNALDAPAQSPFLLPISEVLPEGMRRDTKVDVEKTGLQHTVNDINTLKYTLDATDRVSMEAPSRGGGGGGMGGSGGGRRGGRGGRGGGGGYGGGGGGGYPDGGGQGGGGPQGGGRSGAGRALPTSEMQGDLWLADAAAWPGGVKSPLLPLLQGTLPDTAVLKSICDKINKLKCVPLSTIVTTRLSPGGTGGSYGGAYGGGGRKTMTITMQVKSITEAPLDDALFQVPTDYQKAKIEVVLRRNAATVPIENH